MKLRVRELADIATVLVGIEAIMLMKADASDEQWVRVKSEVLRETAAVLGKAARQLTAMIPEEVEVTDA